MHLKKYYLCKKIITMKLLVQLSGEFLCMIWQLVEKIYTKFVTLRFIFKIRIGISETQTKNGKIHLDTEKLINSFEIKKDRLSNYLLDDYLFRQFVNNFSENKCV